MAIGLVTSTNVQYAGAVNEVSHTSTITSASTAGNTLIVSAISNAYPTVPNKVTDSAGNTYVIAAEARDLNGGLSVAIFSGYQATGLTTSDTLTVTLGWETAVNQVAFHAAEFSNIRRFNAFDKSSAGSGTEPPSASVGPTSALLTSGELAIVAYVENSTSSPTISGGFTSLVNGLNMTGTFNRGLSAGYKLNATTSGESGSYTSGAGKNWALVLATFVPNDFLTTQTAWATA